MPETPFNENALTVLKARYLRRNEQGDIVETPAELIRRVARAVAQAELTWGDSKKASLTEESFHDMLSSLEFLPNSPTLMNAGTEIGQLSACFVLPVEDSMEGIFDAIKNMALVQRSGGGTGFSFSKLRPKGDFVSATSGEASGPVSFMKIFDCATENIKQGGKRRGANMGILRVDHPDILDFIRAKMDGKSLQNFNISVGATDAFFHALNKKEDYDLIHPRTGQAAGKMAAWEVFDALVDAAWGTGDPGLVFLDAINRANPTPALGPIESTNPCGEIPLLPYEACNLGSINLSRMVREENGKTEVDWEKLQKRIHASVRFLDDVIEINRYPIPEIEKIARSNRKIGLGVMGFAEMLALLGFPYDSEEALQLGEKLMTFLAEEAYRASEALALERGVFAHWKGSIHEKGNRKLRNAALTAIAPTGTIGIIAGTSASIEPLFALAYRRSHVLSGRTLAEVNPVFLSYVEKSGLPYESWMKEVIQKGNLRDVKGAPPEIKRLFVTALEISPEKHLKIQAAFQRHVDNSVSKTINLPQESTRQDVADIYRHAWELGLKGITLYRYGSKSAQVLELGSEEPIFRYDPTPKCDPDECKL